MNMIATKVQTTHRLSFVERVARTIAGAALIGSVFVAGDNTLGWLALLPLLGIYPLSSGLTGTTMLSLFENTPAAYRLSHAAASVALIGSVFVISSAPLGVFAVLPLIGIYAALCAMLGRSPLAAVVDANKPIPYIVPPATEVSAAPRTAPALTALSRAA